MPGWLGGLLGAWASWAVAADDPSWQCGRGFGAVGGLNFGVGGWEQVGSTGAAPASSVLLSTFCAARGVSGPIEPSIGVDFAPFYVQPRWDGTRMRQFAVAHATGWFGRPSFRFGPHVRAGYTALGAGLSAGWWSSHPDRAVDTRVEARISGYYMGNFGVQGAVLVTTRRRESP
jgi:hypothetical protein